MSQRRHAEASSLPLSDRTRPVLPYPRLDAARIGDCRRVAVEMVYQRRHTRAVRVGDAVIGGDAPILVQSMITEETRDVAGCVESIVQLYRAGCELVRVTTPTMADARYLGEIRAEVDRRGHRIPL